MESDIDVKLEEIYIGMNKKHEEDEDKINKKLLSDTPCQTDAFCCSNFLECLSSCCFFLYV
jgi:hypothetical protein